MTGGRPNVVWITLESVRADHTSVHGYDRVTTPNMERIASGDRGRSSDDCVSQSMWTPASSASILTGTYLSDHGVGYDGKAEKPLPDAYETLPERLSNAGYRTACISPNAYLSEATGLDRGFDRFHWLSLMNLYRNRETLLPLAAYLFRCRTYGPGYVYRGYEHNKTYPMLRLAKRWLRSLEGGDDPYFCYLHCPNPHLPYAPPRKYRDRYLAGTTRSGSEAVDLSIDVYGDRERMMDHITDGPQFTPDEWATLAGLYDAEIEYADEFVGRIFDLVQRRSDRDTLVVVTGDHGDLFGECGLLGHNLVLHDGLTNVPLVLYGFDEVGDLSDGVVQHVDVTRTVAKRLGVDTEGFVGRDLRDGPGEYAITQRGVPNFESYLESDPEFDASRYHPDPMTAVRTETAKYVHSADRSELFELSDEETPVGDDRPDLVAELDAVRERRIGDLPPTRDQVDRNRKDSAFSEEMTEQLADLGYL